MSQATWYIARAVAASLARNAGDIMRPTRFLSWRDPASRMQSRIRWDGASLPGGALEHLLDGVDQALVRIGGHELHAVDAAALDAAQEPEPRVVRLGVHHRQTQHAAPAALVAADRGDHGGGGHAAVAAALDVGGVEPQVRGARIGQIAAHELGHVGVEALRYGADLVLRQPGYPQLLRDALHLARRGAGGVHLGHRRHDRAVDALIALDHVLGEEAPRPQLRYPHRDVADTRDQVALAVAVAAVGASRAQLVGLGVHDRVHDVLGEAPYELPQAHRPVLEPRHRRLLPHAFC